MVDRASGQLSIEAEVAGATAQVRLQGELDVNAAGALTARLTEIANDGLITDLVVDLAGVTFLDSSGLRAILVGRDRAIEAGATFAVQGISGVVERVIEMTGLRELLIQKKPD